MEDLPPPLKVMTLQWDLAYWYTQLDTHMVIPAPYQRGDAVWDAVTQSRLIESLFLGYLVPSVTLVEENDKFEIVDGLQRLSTWRIFREGGLRLRGLQVIPSLNRHRFGDLSPRYQTRLDRRELSYHLLPTGMGREMFDRLNQNQPLKIAEKLKARQPGPGWPLVEELTSVLLEYVPEHRRANLVKRGGHHRHVLSGMIGIRLDWGTYAEGHRPELGFGGFPLRRGGANWGEAWLTQILTQINAMSDDDRDDLRELWLGVLRDVRHVFGDGVFTKGGPQSRYNPHVTTLQFATVAVVGHDACHRQTETIRRIWETTVPHDPAWKIDRALLEKGYRQLRERLARERLAPPLVE